jgi:hypothetical protein
MVLFRRYVLLLRGGKLLAPLGVPIVQHFGQFREVALLQLEKKTFQEANGILDAASSFWSLVFHQPSLFNQYPSAKDLLYCLYNDF